MKNYSEQLRVHTVIAVITCQRPKFLRLCIDALQKLHLPNSCDITVLIVDNDKYQSAKAGAECYNYSNSQLPIKYVWEPKLGIPFARNRAIDEARNLNADLLCFIDDDEMVDAMWLCNLIDHWRITKAELIGGPVFVSDLPRGASIFQRLMNLSLQKRATRKMERTRQAASNGKKYTIVTNNWLCDLHWQSRCNLRFDESLQFTGGSDTAFFRKANKFGCETAWCNKAIVYENQELERLTIGYQFFRAASQSMNHYRIKNRGNCFARTISTSAMVFVKFVAGAALLIVPIYGIASPVIAVRSIGWSWGRICAIAGKTSKLYSKQR